MTILPGQPAELGEIMALISGAVAKMLAEGLDQWDEIYPDRATIARDLAEKTLYILRDNDELLAVATLNFEAAAEYAAIAWRTDEPALIGHRLAVAAGQQGRGLARRMMHFAEEKACELGCRSFRFDAFPPNAAAVSLYRSMGYREAGRVSFRKGEFFCFEKEISAS